MTIQDKLLKIKAEYYTKMLAEINTHFLAKEVEKVPTLTAIPVKSLKVKKFEDDTIGKALDPSEQIVADIKEVTVCTVVPKVDTIFLSHSAKLGLNTTFSGNNTISTGETYHARKRYNKPHDTKVLELISYAQAKERWATGEYVDQQSFAVDMNSRFNADKHKATWINIAEQKTPKYKLLDY